MERRQVEHWLLDMMRQNLQFVGDSFFFLCGVSGSAATSSIWFRINALEIGPLECRPALKLARRLRVFVVGFRVLLFKELFACLWTSQLTSHSKGYESIC